MRFPIIIISSGIVVVVDLLARVRIMSSRDGIMLHVRVFVVEFSYHHYQWCYSCGC